ncbi:MAG: FecR family protein [Spirochaetia bacterium]|jgi:hypothetical protein
MARIIVSRVMPLLMAGALFMLGGAKTPSSPDQVGDTSYLEGTVSVQRDGQDLDSSEVQTGLAIENYDMVKTAADGLAEVSITTPKSAGATIKVSPRTQFTFELNDTGSRQQSFVGLMSGTIALTVAKLSGSQDLMVHTQSAVMGVRGTEFSVSAPATGDVLITCRTGDVVITDENGKEFHATPGTAVVRKSGEPLGTLEVKGDVDAFRKGWEDERAAFLKEHAIDVIQREAQRYDALADEFDTEFAALQEKKEILAKWSSEEKRHVVVSEAEIEKEKGEIADLLADLRETQFLLERVHYRLVMLRELHDQGFGHGDIRKGLSTKDFFERFEKDRASLELRLASVRHIVKLFAQRNKGKDPTVVADLHRYYERRMAHLKKLQQHKKPVKKA